MSPTPTKDTLTPEQATDTTTATLSPIPTKDTLTSEQAPQSTTCKSTKVMATSCAVSCSDCKSLDLVDDATLKKG